MSHRFGKYEILRRLGLGGAAGVYLARDSVLDRPVALKVLGQQLRGDPGVISRILQDVKRSAGLVHPNIVTIYDYGVQDGIAFIAMEVLPGESLRAAIERKADLPLQQKLEAALQLAKALEHAHGQGVIHGDVTPGNVQLLPGSDIKLTGFGTAAVLSAGAARVQAATGTPGYAAPEQLRGQAPTAASDLFAFGAVVYELLAYRRPFKGEDAAAVRMQTAFDQPPQFEPHDGPIPLPLQSLVFRCLAKKPENRFDSFSPVVAELRRLVQSSSLGLAPVPQELYLGSGPGTSGMEEVVFDESPQVRRSSDDAPADALEIVTPVSLHRLDAEEPGIPPPSSIQSMPQISPAGEASQADFEAALEGGPSRSFSLMLLIGVMGMAASLFLAAGLNWLLSPGGTTQPQEPRTVFMTSYGLPTETPAGQRPGPESPRPSAEPARPNQPALPAALKEVPDTPAPVAAPPAATPARTPIPEPEAPSAPPPAARPPAPPPTVRPRYSAGSTAPSPAEPAPTEAPIIALAAPTSSPPPGPPSPTPSQLAASVLPSPVPSATPPARLDLPTPGPPTEPASSAEAADLLAIHQLLARYKDASERLDPDALREIWPSLKGRRLKTIEEGFSKYASQSLTIEVRRIAIAGETATVQATIRRVIQPKEGERVVEERPVKIAVRKSAKGWVIDD
jgi:serine/threonine-protein kinase